ncbi:hypothetical protein INR49_013756 [Caranx melampygus]|nr:hypothetical protein INR49_013756 [Caranx melampygus]
MTRSKQFSRTFSHRLLTSAVGPLYRKKRRMDTNIKVPRAQVMLCVLGVDLCEPKRGVLLDLYVQTVLFSREHSFKKEQTSALLSIIKSIHEANIETPLNNIEQCFKYCKELLLCHSVRRPPFSVDLFSSKEVDCIFEYIQKSYITHYKLYKYIFTPQVKLDLSLTYSGIPDHEDSSASSGVEVGPKKSDSSERGETPVTEQEETTVGPTSELKKLIEKEVKEQMMLVSGQLDQQMKEIADQHNRALASPQPNHRPKNNG